MLSTLCRKRSISTRCFNLPSEYYPLSSQRVKTLSTKRLSKFKQICNLCFSLCEGQLIFVSPSSFSGPSCSTRLLLVALTWFPNGILLSKVTGRNLRQKLGRNPQKKTTTWSHSVTHVVLKQSALNSSWTQLLRDILENSLGHRSSLLRVC